MYVIWPSGQRPSSKFGMLFDHDVKSQVQMSSTKTKTTLVRDAWPSSVNWKKEKKKKKWPRQNSVWYMAKFCISYDLGVKGQGQMLSYNELYTLP